MNWIDATIELNWTELKLKDGTFWFGACSLIASLLQIHLFICGSARKSKHKPLFKFTWNLPFWKFPQLMKFAFSEASVTFCHIFQRYCNFCSVIFNFATLLQSFLFLATFLHCNYWQNALSSPILFIAFIMQSFTMQFTTWFKFERYSGLHNYWVFSQEYYF